MVPLFECLLFIFWLSFYHSWKFRVFTLTTRCWLSKAGYFLASTLQVRWLVFSKLFSKHFHPTKHFLSSHCDLPFLNFIWQRCIANSISISSYNDDSIGKFILDLTSLPIATSYSSQSSNKRTCYLVQGLYLNRFHFIQVEISLISQFVFMQLAKGCSPAQPVKNSFRCWTTQ